MVMAGVEGWYPVGGPPAASRQPRGIVRQPRGKVRRIHRIEGGGGEAAVRVDQGVLVRVDHAYRN